MAATIKSFKGGKSKAIKGLTRMDARLAEHADELLVAGAEKGEFVVDMDKVAALLTSLDAVQPASDTHDYSEQPEPNEGGDSTDESYNPAAPVAAPNMFSGMAGTILGLPAQILRPAAQTSRVSSRSTYTIEKDRPEQNGIKRPSAGGMCRKVWDACDDLKAANDSVPTSTQIKEYAVTQGWNINNTMIEFYQWRKFNGITGRAKKAEATAE